MLLNDTRLKIAYEFLGNYGSMLTGSQIAGKMKLNQKSVSNALNSMEKEFLLKSKIVGKNKQFYLNLDNSEEVMHFISFLEHFRTLEFYRKNVLIKEVVSKMLPYCDGIVLLFGSYAKGIEKKDSDLDVFIAGKCDVDKIRDIGKTYGIEINIKNYPIKIFESGLSEGDILIGEVLKNHIAVMDVGGFVRRVVRFVHGKD